MAKSKATSKSVDASESAHTPESQLEKYLNKTKGEHYNDVESVDYVVSTGSLALDSELKGGFHPSMVRLVGPSSAGKTSFAFGVVSHFFQTVPNSRCLYIMAEGKLSPELKERTGLTFVTDPTEWRDGTVFVFQSNVYEAVIGLIRELLVDNPSNHVYCFILDSMDGLNLRNDMLKSIEEGNRVAGAPKITKEFLQKVSVAMSKHGHLCFFLGQVSAEIKLDPYAKGVPRQVGGSGGNAIQHFASHVLEFQNWYEGDLILEKPSERLHRINNPALGHLCKIKIVKTDLEKRYVIVEIPIRHNQVAGRSIWREREVGDLMLAWGLVSKGGTWLTLTPAFISEAEKQGITGLPEKVQGMNQLYALLDERKDLTDYLFAKFKAMASGTT